MNTKEAATFDPEESLRLITQMINKAKSEYIESGISALLWGSVVTFCALVFFGNHWWHIGWINDYIWMLTFIAVVPQVVISIRESKKRKFKTHTDDAMGGIWIAFGITMFMLSFYTSRFNIQHVETLYLIVYGIPTFSTGITRHFKPMIRGGIACWVLAIVSMYTSFPYTMLLLAGAAQLAWFIPGLLLRARYQKLKKAHV